MAAGEMHSLALKADGTVVAWGFNLNGECRVYLPGHLAGGYNHSLSIQADGTVVAWGLNSLCKVPPDLTYAFRVATGLSHSLAVTWDRTMVAWGDNDRGQCDVPPGLTNVWIIAAGGIIIWR